jgi:hypothetical protein
VEPGYLLGADAGDLAELEQPLRPRERGIGLAVDRRPIARGLPEPLLDPRALAHRDPLPDDERHCRLVRRVEADRPKVAVLLLKPADDRVSLADRGPAGPVVVEREGPRCLADDRREILGGGVGATDDPPVLTLAELDCRARQRSLDREGQRDRGLTDRAAADPGRESAGEVPGRPPG